MTVQEIARLSGVSIGTVDRVLHNRGRVAPETKEKILTIINQVQYQPNPLARHLQRNKEYKIGLLMPELERESSYWNLVYKGLLEACEEHAAFSFKIEFFKFCRSQVESFKMAFNRMLKASCDASIIAPVMQTECKQLLLSAPQDFAYAFIDSPLPGTKPITTVAQNPHRAGFLAGRLMELLVKGNGPFAVIQPFDNAYNLFERARGFKSWFDQRTEKQTIVDLICSEDDQALIKSKIQGLIQAEPQLKGIFIVSAFSHLIADIIWDLGLKDDIIVIGFDLVEQNKLALLNGRIDCLISQDPEEQARLVVRQVFKKLVLNEESVLDISMPINIYFKENILEESLRMNENNGKTTRLEELAFLSEHNPSSLKQELISEFIEAYKTDEKGIEVFFAPARINIIGEHIDYNGGKVFPAAIDKYIYFVIKKRNDRTLTYNDLRFPGELKFSIDDAFVYKKENDYANYLNGMLKIIKDRGFDYDSGFDLLMFSTIPAGGGVSSSSALAVGFGYAISSIYGFNIDRISLAKIAQQSEHEFMNVMCGIMDQFVIANAKSEHALVLDTNTLEYEHIPLELQDYRIVVMNTNKKRQLADSKYNERRSECETGLAILQKHIDISALCQMDSKTFEANASYIQDPVIQKRVKHCVYENERVLNSVKALKNGDLDQLGSLLCQSHESLRDDYEVTGIELDTLYEIAKNVDGCLGARMTGAGFGGCAIAIVHKDSVENFITEVDQTYTKKIGYEPSCFACKIGDGVNKFL